VEISQLKPIPLNINNTSWVDNDVVEVYEYDYWWVGNIICHLPCATKYVVYFPESSKEMQVDASCIRFHQHWV
jgi:hypothetical protein